MALNNATNTYSNSRYIVDNVAPGMPYTTIQSAINAAQAAGGNAEIWVRQGTYTENLTLYDTINIEGAEQTLSILIGTHTPPAAGSCRFSRMGLRSATDIFSSAAAGTATLSCLRCQFLLINGYVYNLPNWTGDLRLRWCTDYSTHNGLVYNTGGSTVTMNHSLIGKGTTSVFTANGNVTMFSVLCDCPMLFNGTGISILEGACVFGGNIATANTHLLRIAQCRLSTGVTQAITHNSASTLVLDNVIVGTSNATAIGGTGTIKMVMVAFPTSNTLAGTITQSLDGVTRTAEMWAENIIRMKDTGFYSWAAGGPYFNDATLGTFKLLVGGTGYIKNQRVTWVAQDYVGMTAGNTYFIYIDSTGTIGAATSHTNALYEDYIVLFQCMRDSTPVTNNQVTVKENHPYSFQPAPSNWMHDVAGILIENNQNGANITLDGTQGIQINGADVLNDHGLETIIPDSGGAAVTWIRMYTTAGGKWARQNATTTFTGYWNNAGTPTALTANRWAVYTLYVSKDSLNTTTPTYFAVLNTAQYTTQANANTAISNGTTAKASGELAALELAQLGFITYRQSTAAITNVVISKSTLRATFSTGGTNTASLVNTDVTNFNGWLSAADSNVQAALDTLDDVGLGVTPQHAVLLAGAGYAIDATAVGGTGELLVGAAGADPAFGTSATGDFTFTSATAAQDRALTVSNTDNTAVASSAHLQLTVGGSTSTGDPYINFLVTGGGTYSIGPDNSDSDLLKITTGATPSAGSTLMTIAGSGNVYVNLGDLYTQRTAIGGIVECIVANADNTNAASDAGFYVSSGGPVGGDPFINFLVSGAGTYSLGINNNVSDIFSLTNGTSPSAGTRLFSSTSTGVIDIPLTLHVGNGANDLSAIISATQTNIGTPAYVQIKNDDNTNAASHAQLTISTGGSSGGDAKVEYFEATSSDGYVTGLDNSDANKWKLSYGAALGTNDTIIATVAGEVTMPLQPAFLATQTAAQNNLPINTATTFTVNNEIFDQNSDYNAGTYTFTSPVTGKYYFNGCARLSQCDTASGFYSLIILTSNRAYYYTQLLSQYASDPNNVSFQISTLADMDAADTCVFQIGIPNAGANQADVDLDAGTIHFTYFSGSLEC